MTLLSCIQTIEEFHNIFGPELKAVTGDPERIDTVIKRVNGLVTAIEEIKFDPSNQLNKLVLINHVMFEKNCDMDFHAFLFVHLSKQDHLVRSF